MPDISERVYVLIDCVIEGSKEGSWIVFEVRSKHTKSISKANGNNVEICVLLPVLKGDVMILGIDSTATYTTTQIQPGFFFVYANGED